MKIIGLIVYCIIIKLSINIIPFDIGNGVKYIGVNDHYDHYKVSIQGPNPVPNGVAYNSYVIIDEKILIVEGIHEFYQKEWLANLDKALNGRKPDYILIQHMEPDHSGTLNILIKKYPNVKIVSSIKAFNMMKNIYNEDYNDKRIVVKEGDKLSLGKHVLQFIEAPMVHWPEVMFSYDLYTNYLFSCDAFGKFGANDVDEPWEDESRRFYFGILGKYEKQVQSALNKISKFKIKMILPSHGPILTQNIDHYLSLYDKWSKYIPEEDGVVIVYSTVHGHTKIAVDKLAEKLKTLGVKYVIHNLATSHWTNIISDAFKYNSMILASVTIDNDVSPFMKEFIEVISTFNYQNRIVGFIENGSWNPSANQIMKSLVSQCKNISFFKNTVSVYSSLKESSINQINNLAYEIGKFKK